MRKLKKLQVFSLLIFVCLSFLMLNFPATEASDTKPTLWIKIHRIEMVDDIEDFLQGGPEWYYQIRVWDGEGWKQYTRPTTIEDGPVEENNIHYFTLDKISSITTIFYITLLESDAGADEVADISSHSGAVASDQRVPAPRGAIYEGHYNLKTNSLLKEGDIYYFEEGYYKTSGDYDDSIDSDENDANLWFDIWDNYDAPGANAGLDQTVMVGEKVNFDTSGSTASSGSSIERYQWDFESDGNYDWEGKTASYTYNKKGVYTVTLKITDSIGETATDNCTINVITPPAPIAIAGLNQTVDVGERVDFDGSGSRASKGATIEKYQWDFNNDGHFDSEGANTFWIYETGGTYIVTLNVTDNFGQSSTDTCIITVRGEPTASFTFTPQEPTIQLTIYFYDTSSDPDGSIVSWYWDFGDDQTSTMKDPTHKYADKGNYNVILTVTDNDGYRDSKIMTITVQNIAPTANFTYSPSSPKVEADIHFTDKSSDPEGKTLEYLWDFGDGFTSTQQNPTHQYETSGTKYVKLIVMDDEGVENSTIKSIIVVLNKIPITNFSYAPENQKINNDVHFTDESTDKDGYIVKWLWDFGDGTTSTQKNPTHKFKKGGEYSVRLTVTDDNGDSDEIIKKANIIQTYVLTLEVKDVLGLNIANVYLELFTDGECCASGSTDKKGKLTLTEIPEGNYEIQAKVLGVTTSTTCSLTQSRTEQIRVLLSINTISITGGFIIVIAVLGFYLSRRGKISPPAEETKPEEEAVPEEDTSLKMKKIELEKERITDILNVFKWKFEKGEIDEETYLRLKKKYEKELEKLEEN